MDEARRKVERALEIASYLAVKYQNADADEACRLLADALLAMEEYAHEGSR